MTDLGDLASGAAIGLSIAAPIGPMAILCINRSVNAGIAAGICTGAGASTVHATYASVVLFGLRQVTPFLAHYRLAMSVVSTGVMLLFAWRILKQKLHTPRGESDADSILKNYSSAVVFCCFNPLLFVLLLGTVGVAIGPQPPFGPTVWLVLLGVFVGSLGWWTALSTVTSAVRGFIRPNIMRGFNRVAATGMLVCAALSLARAFRL
jgi:threonine/homoserine/homoserine lactone efflux protein